VSSSHGFPVHIPFLADLGVELFHAQEGESEIVLESQERHQNSWHVVHGGVTMTLLDVAMAMAGRSQEADALGSVTVEMSASFLQPARGRLVARGKCYHRTKTLAFCEAELRDATGNVVAKAMGTFKFIRRLDVASSRHKEPHP
jgi:uncharacterized protein (TIGR00369 family)